MSEDFAIRIEGLTKEFVRSGGHRTLFRVLRSLADNKRVEERHPSLDGIDLEVPRGGILGIIGENGAGKTTLLKTIAGLYRATSGRITINGEVALLAGLGAGMVDDLTVSDNIWLYGAICRIPRSTTAARFGDLLRWAELEGFAAAELRTLSMGMRTRLAFAIAMNIESPTVLMDEAFSAGDQRFQEKCNTFFAESKLSGRTFLIATHNLEFVREFCERTLWIHRGRVKELGPTAKVLDDYNRFNTTSGQR